MFFYVIVFPSLYHGQRHLSASSMKPLLKLCTENKQRNSIKLFSNAFLFPILSLCYELNFFHHSFPSSSAFCSRISRYKKYTKGNDDALSIEGDEEIFLPLQPFSVGICTSSFIEVFSFFKLNVEEENFFLGLLRRSVSETIVV